MPDSDTIVQAVQKSGAIVVIPPKKTRKVQREYDKYLYRKASPKGDKERNLVERLFNKLKNFRRVATRYGLQPLA